ncbi:MAG: putative lipoprotein [Methylococcaceae bacterium]|nr:putative lipoprotein [Methylococcaceae bacterium]
MQIKSYLFPIFVVAGLAQGCSFSASSESSSDSSKSSSDSIKSIISSPSSSSANADKEYQIKIMDYTTAYLSTAGFERAAYIQGISEIATEAGITQWEDDENTLIGIGRALKKAKLTGSVYETYKKSLADAKESRMLIIQKGYDQQ